MRKKICKNQFYVSLEKTQAKNIILCPFEKTSENTSSAPKFKARIWHCRPKSHS